MTYTRLADIYVGDASSQVYEFLREPRPCLFLDPHATAWEGDASFGHWAMGPVATTVGDLVGQIDGARRTHTRFREAQVAGFVQTFDLRGAPSSVRAATAVARLCHHAPSGRPLSDTAHHPSDAEAAQVMPRPTSGLDHAA
jgi:hypothetical protein